MIKTYVLCIGGFFVVLFICDLIRSGRKNAKQAEDEMYELVREKTGFER